MMRKSLTLALILIVVSAVAMATPVLQEQRGEISSPPMFDTFDDTIKYDDNISQWWYGGLNNYKEATRFTPLANFEFQKYMLAFQSTGTVTVYLKSDNAGTPGTTLWTGSANITSAATWMPFYVDTTGLYTFTAGQDFWVQFDSPGPPYETFDNSPVVPIRSKIMFPGGTTWSNAPGDNFIRAVGEYTSSIVDVAVDSVWHGNNFFVTNGTSYQVGAKVRNASANPASFAVGCRIYTEVNETTYTYFDSLEIHNIMLAPGASTTVNFNSFAWNTDNRYRIDVHAYYTGDVNPDNNVKSIETQVYTTPPPNVTLRYDDTVTNGAAYSSVVGDGWGMKFNPHQAGTYDIGSISVSISFSTGDLAARIKLLSDNAGVPGTVLWETVGVLTDGWNDFATNVTNTGSFYIMYYFENGASTSALSLDDGSSSAQAWSYSSTTGFTPNPSSNDWAMRATLGEGAAYPEFVMTVDYVSGSPVPAGGGNLNFDVYMANNSGQTHAIDVWLESSYQGGTPNTLVLRNFPAYQTGWAINRPGMFYPVAGSWAAGNYTFAGKVGDNPGIAWAEDSFPFVKSGVSDGTAFQPFPVDGAPDPFDRVEMGDAVASQFGLIGNYPNPFNPTTTISYVINSADKVELSVFDLSGRQVAKLVDGYRNAGVHQVNFDASGLASGVYISRLTSSGNTTIAKMVLMK